MAKDKNTLSPMMSQYIQTKENYKDCIVFYRLGDFYEMFFDDAIKASSLLELTLTGKDCGLTERAPMCGVPYHAADEYIAKLVALGEKVAVCEQVSPPGGKDIVKREVVRVVSAGTITNDELIDNKSNNFICSVYLEGNNCSLSWSDITTGEFFAKEFCEENNIQNLVNELVKISPAEIICNKEAYSVFSNSPLVLHGVLPKFSLFIESEFNISIAKDTLINKFKVLSVSALRLKETSLTINSSGALLAYLKETQKHALRNITSIKVESLDDFVMLDANATRNLELVKTLHDGKRYGSLLWLLDKTKTAMGARKLQNWILFPLSDPKKINYRLNGVECLFNSTLVRQSIHEILSGIKDIGRLAGKLSNGNFAPKDCVLLKSSLELIPSIKFNLLGINDEFICDISNKLIDFSKVVTLLSQAIVDSPPATTKDGGYIKEGFNEELDSLRKIAKNGKGLLAELENKERERTGIKNLKISYNRVFGYYIEITNSFKDRVPYDYIRRQTLSNAERYVTEGLKELESKILNSDEQSLKLEATLFNQIKDVLFSYIDDFNNCSDAIADLDVLVSFAIIARQNNYCKPEILENDGLLEIIDGRHPVVEKTSTQKFVPNDCCLDNKENRTIILTGPNMAGKSTYMRQNAVICLMAHVGCFVPAKLAKIPLVDKIFTRIGASDNLISDQSTFMVEMTELSDILSNATSKSLIILDEIGRGTSTFDGLSIAWAVVEYITKNIRAKTMFATHYHELTELEGVFEGVKNYKITVKELQNTIVFLRKIMRGGANRSFGIEVAQLAGVKHEVIDRAKDILKTLEKNDLTKSRKDSNATIERVESKTEVEKILLDLDVNNLSPMQAFNVLVDLQEKLKEKYE